MSSKNGHGGNGRVQVTDEENGVDQQLKQQVLKLRETVDEDERALYVDRVRDREQHYTRTNANQDWALSIRQYLRSIKRLWDNEGDIAGVQEYWQELPIGTVELAPPDAEGYQFSLVASRDAVSQSEMRRAIGLPRGADIPTVYREQFNGLSSVLNTRVVEHTWSITVDASGPPPSHRRVTVQAARPVPKHILENALEAADAFLQQAGLGFETSLPDYYGGTEAGI